MVEKVEVGGVELYLGDCLDILPTLEAKIVDAVITDPPYCSGGRQQSTARNIISKSDSRMADEWFLADNMGTDTYMRFMRQVAGECLRVCKIGAHSYVFTDWRQFTNLTTAWESKGWTLKNVIVWDKNRGGAMGSFWRNNHEWICVFSKGSPKPLPNNSFFNTWKGSKPQGGYHPTEKPINLMRYLVRANDGIILDPFFGSGTTAMACHLEKKIFIGIEQDKEYFDYAIHRIKNEQKKMVLDL